MAEPTVLTRRHPLENRRASLEALDAELDGTLHLGLEPLGAAVDLRIDPAGEGPGALGHALGGALPSAPDSWSELDAGQALRLGPDEWLLLAGGAAPEELEARVDALAAPHGGVAVDVSAQRVGIRVAGPAARDLLSFGCSLDLRPSVLGRGRCAQTLLGQAAVLLVAHGAQELVLHVRSSFAGAVVDALLDAAVEYRPDPARSIPA